MDEDDALDFDTPGEADDGGHNNAVDEAFEQAPSGTLCYGSDCYDDADISESDGDSDYSYETEEEQEEYAEEEG